MVNEKMSSQEVLELELENMKNDISEMKEDIKEIKNMFWRLDERYPTRREVKVLVGAIWFIATVLWIVATILWFTK